MDPKPKTLIYERPHACSWRMRRIKHCAALLHNVLRAQVAQPDVWSDVRAGRSYTLGGNRRGKGGGGTLYLAKVCTRQ